jgi:hypothetical protein
LDLLGDLWELEKDDFLLYFLMHGVVAGRLVCFARPASILV